MKKRYFPTTLLLSLFALSALAFEAMPPPPSTRQPNFVLAEQLHPLLILSSPPAADSDKGKAELVYLHQLATTRTPQQIAKAKADDLEQSVFLYRDVLGDKFQAANLPLTKAFFSRVGNDESVVIGPAKSGFGRARPYNQDKTLNAICRTHSFNDSYPSGHTTNGYLLGLVLVEMLPEKRDAILTRAEEYAQNRLVCSSHYPSDVAGGKSLAYATHAVMAINPQYRQELAVAREELRRVLGLAALK